MGHHAFVRAVLLGRLPKVINSRCWAVMLCMMQTARMDTQCTSAQQAGRASSQVGAHAMPSSQPSVPEHVVIESKPDNIVDDLR